MSSRLTRADLELIRRFLSAYQGCDGVSEVLEKLDQSLAEDPAHYIKVVRFEFVENGAPDNPVARPGHWLESLRELGCRVLRHRPPPCVVQMPEHGDDFDAAIDLLDAWHRHRLIRYRRH